MSRDCNQTSGEGFFFDEEVLQINPRKLLDMLRKSPHTLHKLKESAPSFLTAIRDAAKNFHEKPFLGVGNFSEGLLNDYECEYTTCSGLAVLYTDIVNEHTGLDLVTLEDEERGNAVVLPNGSPWSFTEAQKSLKSSSDLADRMRPFSEWVSPFPEVDSVEVEGL